MKFVGLAGGIGCGKSTVGAALRARGAVSIDVDQLSRDLQEPGQPLFDEIVARWGDGILGPDGRLDRAALGKIVFADKEQLAELTAMAAPHTENELVARANAHQGTDQVVVAEAAQYLSKIYGLEAIILVDTPPDIALDRLINQRGMDPVDAETRIKAQLPRELRAKFADYVLDNSGDAEQLEKHLDDLWAFILATPDADPRVERTPPPTS